MLTFGEVLYQPGPRDFAGIQLEAYFRETFVTIGVGATDGFQNYTWDSDRMMYVDTLTWFCDQGAAAQRWSEVAAFAYVGPRAIARLGTIADAVGVLSGGDVASNRLAYTLHPKIILPRGSYVAMTAKRTADTTQAVQVGFNIAAYTLPPANVARSI